MSKFLIVLLITIELGKGQLIRPNFIYKNVIKGIYNYYSNTCIIMLHATPNPIQSEGIQENTNLKNLQEYFSKLYIRTAVIDIKTFMAEVGRNYYHIKRPLFVILNDSDNVKQQLMTDVNSFIDMAYPNWLIFFKNETKVDHFFDGISIPFDCVFLICQADTGGETITEVYQIDRYKGLRRGFFASWNLDNGMKYSRLSLYQRRNDLQGHPIRVISIEDPPSSTIKRNGNNVITGMGGVFGGVMDLLKESINCSLIYQEAHSWGYLTDNGSWTGAVASLMQNESDIFAAELMMTADRLNSMKFTTPIYSTKCRAWIKRPSITTLKWDAYITPFTRGIWTALGITIIFTSFVIFFIIKLSSKTMLEVNNIEKNTSKFVDSVFGVFGAFCSQGIAISPLNPIRMVHLVIHTTAVIIIAAYSAALISALAVRTYILPFTTMNGLLENGNYRFAVVGESADFSFFKNTSDEVLSVLFDEILLKETDLPDNYFNGLKRVCKEDNYAFMALDNMVSQLQSSVGCKLEPLDTISQTSIGMALRPASPFRGIINSNILSLRDSGILQRLLHSDWALPGDNIESSWSSVDLTNILPLIAALFGGFALSCFLLLCEKIFHFKYLYRKRNSNDNRNLIIKKKIYRSKDGTTFFK